MKNTIKIVLLCLITLSVQACKQPSTKKPKTVQKPNILWIVSEDNSPWLRCYGDSIATTPNLDKLASESILFTNAYSNAPVCAPSRNTLITGMFSPALGTQHMRSAYKIPDHIQFYPKLLKDAGYYTSNNSKKDYNTTDIPEIWNESSKTATYKNRQEGQPFFHIQNLMTSHESRLHRDSIPKNHNPESIKLYPYHPDTPEIRRDYAVYYDRLQDLDVEVGKILADLEKEGLSENTIVFYYSDHGGPVAGTKRFATQQGLHVPLIVHIPEKFQHLTKYKAKDRIERPISFIDFPPTLMELIDADIPEQFQGTPFLNPENDNNLVFGFAGRMDERINMVRTVTDGRYRYTRNYFPNTPYGTHLQFLWNAKGMQSWHETYLEGKTNKAQSTFFEARPFEELYDIVNDPFQLNNLFSEKKLNKEGKSGFALLKNTEQDKVRKLTKALVDWQIQNRDSGLIPEAMLQKLNDNGLIYDFTHSDSYPIKEIIALAQAAGSADHENFDQFITALRSEHPVKQYWAAIGFQNLKEAASLAIPDMKQLIFKVDSFVGIVLAETLYGLNEKKYALEYLLNILDHDQLLVRVQALNALDNMSEIPKVFEPTLKELANKIQGRKRPYDVRLAVYLLEK